MNKPVELRYLPLYYEDLSAAVQYLSRDLGNSSAARRLLNETERAILERLPAADCFAPLPEKNRSIPYYRIHVRNYTIYYVVFEFEDRKIMEVRRLIHKSRNSERLL